MITDSRIATESHVPKEKFEAISYDDGYSSTNDSGIEMKTTGALHVSEETEEEETPLLPSVPASASSSKLHTSSTAAGSRTLQNTSNKKLSIILEEDNEENDNEHDPLLEVMDLIEDEVDHYGYDDLVPLQVKLALEETVFGWSNLMSDIFGHIVFTLGYYLLMYALVTQICWKRDKEGDYILIWGMSDELFGTIRAVLSIVAGFNGFRTVRRRRRVWLRAPYGTHSSEVDEKRRRILVAESDRTTLLGRIRGRRESWLHRRVERKLNKANSRFERKIKKQSSSVVALRPRSDANIYGSPSRPKKRLSSSTSPSYFKTENTSDRCRSLSPFRQNHSSTGTRRRKNGRRPSFRIEPRQEQNLILSHTGPTSVMESIRHDQILFSCGTIQNMLYAHGGFFGTAPFMLANPYWIDILRHLMPDVYVAISPRVHRPAPELIHWAENNPIVAAYGSAHELEYNGKLANLEWDVFLDPHLVQRIEIVLDEREKFIKLFCNTMDEKKGAQSAEAIAVAKMTESERAILGYYDAEIKRRTQLLCDRMLIAHGNVTQLLLEQAGIAKKYNFSRVKRTCRTLGGGITARQWLALYAEALRMSCSHNDDEDEYVSTSMEDEFAYSEGDLSTCSNYSTPQTSDDESDFPPGYSSYDDATSSAPKQQSGCSSSEYGKVPRTLSEPNFNQIVSTSDDELSDDEQKNIFNRNDGSPSKSKRHDGGALGVFRSRSPPRTQGENRGDDLNSAMLQYEFLRERTTSLDELAWSKCPDLTIEESITVLKSLMKCNAPLGLMLDVKSRHVPKRVWALVVDVLREAGARVEGIASFIVEEIRGISDYCTVPVKEVLFFHSAGDVQEACHNGRIQPGDVVFFNGGSLFWEAPDYSDASALLDIVHQRCYCKFDSTKMKKDYKFLPYARVKKKQYVTSRERDEDEDRHRHSFELEGEMNGLISGNQNQVGSTIQMYKEHYNLSIGMYVQEFAVDEAAVSMLVKLCNEHPEIYNLGLSWGGVNGVTVKGIQPGRFTNTDGFWNQRYICSSWNSSLSPDDARMGQ